MSVRSKVARANTKAEAKPVGAPAAGKVDRLAPWARRRRQDAAADQVGRQLTREFARLARARWDRRWRDWGAGR